MAENRRLVTSLYNNDKFMGTVAILLQIDYLPFQLGDELRVSSLSPSSDRCLPLVVLHTISSDGVLFKMEPTETPPFEYGELELLHSQCLKEFKTAVVLLEGGHELHLVAMSSRGEHPCFWGFLTSAGLYNSCLAMLNLRCLALVFDLDETLIVANTMRSFEDRIEALDRKIRGEIDPQRLSGMSAELKRYQEDKTMLKQFVDHDHVWDTTTEKFVNAHNEVVRPLTEGALPLMRPMIRLQERNMILTRINPNVRDTSVLVRLRPAWEELRSYLTAKGRKRFEVYICTMSEKDYALEMWRLLDPEAQLINARELLERVVCVKSGSKKSLINVFPRGRCHPKMAMVIDDRLKVWEDRDQSHVHVVPAFAPYYAPQAETNSPLPILCVARNVACNVRGGFFKDFDEGFSKNMAEVLFETDVSTLPHPPDVSNYLTSEEETAPTYELANGVKDFPDGMTDAEVERRLDLEGSNSSSSNISGNEDANVVPQIAAQKAQPTVLHPPAVRSQACFGETQVEEKQDLSLFPKDLPMLRSLRAHPVHLFEPSVQSSPVREEGEVPESELDPDTRRRLLILQHGQDTEHPRNPLENTLDSPFPLKASLQLTIPSVAPPGGWLGAEEEMSPRQISRSSSGIILEPESPSFGKQRTPGLPFFSGPEFLAVDCGPHDMRRRMPEEALLGEDRQRSESMFDYQYSDDDDSLLLKSTNLREFQLQSGRSNSSNATNPVSVLQDIAQKVNTRVEFRSLLNTTKELQFSVEVLFGGEKVGEGIGRTKKEAQHRAAENALRFMASQFLAQPVQPSGGLGNVNVGKSHPKNADDDYVHWNTRDPRFSAGLGPMQIEEDIPAASTSGQSKFGDFRLIDEPKRSFNAVNTLKEWCTSEGVNVVFNEAPTAGALPSREFQAQVEVAGRIMGKGSGPNWEAAKQQAAEEAMRQLKSSPHVRVSQKRINSPRSPPLQSSKRLRSGEFMRGMQRLSTSPRRLSPRRYARNGPSVP